MGFGDDNKLHIKTSNKIHIKMLLQRPGCQGPAPIKIIHLAPCWPPACPQGWEGRPWETASRPNRGCEGPPPRFSRVLTRGYYGSPSGCHRPSPRVLGSPPRRYTHQGAQVPGADVKGHHPGFSGPRPAKSHTRGRHTSGEDGLGITGGLGSPPRHRTHQGGPSPLVGSLFARETNC